VSMIELLTCQREHIGLRYCRIAGYFFPGTRNGSKRMDDSHRRQLACLVSHFPQGFTRLSFLLLWFWRLLPVPPPRIGFAPAPASALKRFGSRFPTSSLPTATRRTLRLLKTFNDTFWNDLDNSGVVELISKSFYPLQVPGQPPEVTFGVWNSPPPNAAMLAFGNLGVAAGKLTVQGWLYDVKNAASPLVIGKQYTDVPTDDAARVIAHQIRR
jgi:hypothetical protein